MSYSDLPFVSTEYDKHICDPCCECPFSKTLSKAKTDEDRRIKSWNEWMQDRRYIHRKIGNPINRHADELLMNANEELRGVVEDRMVIQYTNIPKPFDKYRGNPAFWKLPVSLKHGTKEEPTHFSVMGQQEKNIIPCIEYVKVPDLIKIEKESQSKRDIHVWNKLAYFQKRIKDCRELIENIEPHKPVLKDLIIIGKSLKPTPCEPIDEVETCLQDNDKTEGDNKPTKCFLIINDIPIYENATNLKKIRLIQDYNIKTNRVQTIYLILHNKTNICLRFCFTQFVPTSMFEDLRPTFVQTKQVFFYDKNEHMVQPGQKLYFPFWFKTNICGPCTNTLELKFTPDLWDHQLKIIITFQTNAGSGSFDKCCLEISERLDSLVRNSIIKDVLYRICKKVRPKLAKIAVYTYDKAAIFESVNAVYDPLHFRPKYLYDKSVVNELEIFYKSVKLNDHPEFWDYKLDTLRIITKDREHYDEEIELQNQLEAVSTKVEEHNEERTKMDEKALSFWIVKEVEKNKTDSKKKDKKSKKGSSKSDKSSKDNKKTKKSEKLSKNQVVKGPPPIIITEPVREDIPSTLSDKLEQIILKLKSPSTWHLEHQRKLTFVYTILCCYVDKISEEVKCLENRMCVNRLHPKMRKQQHIETKRIYDEKPDESFIQSPRLIEISGSPTDKPAPDWSETIPLGEYDKRYKAYHGLVEESGKKDKSKSSKSGSKASKKSPKVKKKEKISKKKEIEIIKQPETIFPVETFTTVDEESTPDEDIEIPLEYLEHYNNSIYLLFYTNLQRAIDDIIAIFELQPKSTLPFETIQKIAQTHGEIRKVKSNVSVKVFDLKRAISEILKQDDAGIDKTIYSPGKSPALTTSDISMWSILDSYKKTSNRKSPKKDGDIYTIITKPFPVVTCNADTSVTPEEVVTERLTQTTVSGLKSAKVSGTDGDQNDETLENCYCGVEETKSEIEMSYYDSKINFDAVSSDDSITDCKYFEK